MLFDTRCHAGGAGAVRDGCIDHLDEQHRAVFSNRREDDAHHELLHDPSRMGKAGLCCQTAPMASPPPNGLHRTAETRTGAPPKSPGVATTATASSR